jgi:hypothetical protein
VDVSVTGAQDWVRGFTRLILDLDTPDVVRGAGQQVARTAFGLAPVASGFPRAGFLRSTIEVRPTRGPAVFVGAWARYATFVHEGTRYRAARPFLTAAAAAADPAGKVDTAVDTMIGRGLR